jgi:hypothetical protein
MVYRENKGAGFMFERKPFMSARNKERNISFHFLFNLWS